MDQFVTITKLCVLNLVIKKGPFSANFYEMIRKSHQRIKLTTKEDLIWTPNCPEARECGNFYRDASFYSVLGCGLEPVLRQFAVSLLVSADTEGVLHMPYMP